MALLSASGCHRVPLTVDRPAIEQWPDFGGVVVSASGHRPVHDPFTHRASHDSPRWSLSVHTVGAVFASDAIGYPMELKGQDPLHGGHSWTFPHPSGQSTPGDNRRRFHVEITTESCHDQASQGLDAFRVIVNNTEACLAPKQARW